MKTLRIGIAIAWLFIMICQAEDQDATGMDEYEESVLKSGQSKEELKIQEKQIEELKEKVRKEMLRILYGDWDNLEERTRFIRVVVAMIGTPYKYEGSSTKGLDCSWFTQSMYKLFGADIPRTTKKQFLVGMLVERDKLEEGDLVFFDGSNKPMHVGIYIGAGKIVHVSSVAKQVRMDFLDSPWEFKHFIGAVRIRELKHGGRETR